MLDSIQGRINQFNNALQTMWNNALDSDLIKGIVNFGTELIKIIDKIGLLPTLLGAIGIKNLVPWLLKGTTHTETLGAALKVLAFGADSVSISSFNLAKNFAQLFAETTKGIPAMISFGYQAQGLTGAMSQLGKGIGMTWAAIPGVGKIMLIVAAIGAVVAIVDALTTSVKETAQAAEEAISTYKNATQTLKDHHDTIEDIKSDYAELADGVDSLGRNVSLSTEEYARYNEITNKIADMFPHMVTGYTEEGNAIIALKGNVDALTAAYEAEAQAARDAILVKQNDIFTNFSNNTTKDNFWSSRSKVDELKFFEDIISGKSVKDFSYVGTAWIDGWLENAGIDSTNWFTSHDEMDRAIQENLASVQAYYNILKAQIEAEAASVRTILNAYLEQDFDYLKLSDEGKKVAQSIIAGFDTEFYSQFASATEMEAWVKTNVIQPLQNTGNMEQFNIAFDLQTRFNNGDVDVDEYIDQITEFTELLATLGFDEEIVKTIKAIFQIDDYETKKNSAMDILDSEGDKSVGTLSKSDLDLIDKNKTQWQEELKIDGKVTMSWEELLDKLEEARTAAWEASVDFETVSKSIDGIQDAYSALSDAVEQYNKDGYLTLDNLQALLSLEPEYLACLQMENGQLSINQTALETMIQTKLAEAKATAVQNAITQLNALAARTEADEINNSTNAANNAISGLGSYASSLGIVAQNAIGAAGAVSAFNAAVEGAQGNELVDQAEIDAVLANLNNQINLIDSVSANLGSNFKNIVNPDTSSSGSGGSDDEDELETLQKKYERQITNLDNQQTYLQNEVERLEAENAGISKEYYEEQITLEEQKLDLYRQEREELLKLERTDEVAEALWEVEHAIQESTLRMVEFRQSIVDLYKTAFDEIGEAYDNQDDLFSDRQNYIEKYRELLDLQDSPEVASGYKEQIALEADKLATNTNELAALQELLARGVASGYLKEGSDEWIEMQDQIRATEEAILDNKIALEQYKEEMKDLQIEAWNTVRDAFDNKNQYYQNQQDYIEGYADYLEAFGVDVPNELYDKLISIEEEKRANLVADLTDARATFDQLVADGVMEDSEDYQEAYQTIVDLEKGILDCDIATAQWAKTIRDMSFEKFERFMSRLDDLNSEIEHIQNLLDDEDVAFEDGTWTKEGITMLGLYYQQMQLAQQKSEEYAEKIEELNETYAEGTMSEQEYYEQLQNLKDGQWEAIESYHAAEDALVDMEEARIDMIEEGINEEIDAYQELIELKKEELDAERDLYDFKKNIQKQTKDIASLQRRIASMSGSTDATTIAERTKLEAQLREAQEGLDDTYYSHSKDAQSQALDDENDAYVDAQEKYIEMLRDTLDDTMAIVNQKISEFLLNADVGLEQLNGISTEHGITLSSALMQPWENAAMTVDAFRDGANNSLYSLINEDGVVTIFNATATPTLKNVFSAGGSAATLFASTVNTQIGNIKKVVENATSPLTTNLKFPWEDTSKVNGPITTFGTAAKDAMDNTVNKAKGDYQSIQGYLSTPWGHAAGAAQTFSNHVDTVMKDVVADAEAMGRAIDEVIAKQNQLNNLPSYVGTGTGNGGGGGGGSGAQDTSAGSKVHKVQATLKTSLKTFTAVAKNTSKAEADSGARRSVLTQAQQYYLNSGYDPLQVEKFYTNTWYKNVKLSAYAKGTTGIDRDEWAITDEPWLGDELTMYATPQGTLSYMRAGSTVVPADLTREIIDIAKVGVDGLTMPKFDSGITFMTNAINKPELNISFDALVKAEKITEDTLPAVKQLVKEELDKFSRNLNYSLRKVGAH